MRSITICILIFLVSYSSSFAQGPYAPAAGHLGTLAIHKDSSLFVAWASSCQIIRGLQNIADPNSDTSSIGEAANALGIADGLNVVSLGDSGSAILTFDGNIYNGLGPDFAVFENSFNNTFLELAFVEVSSDGTNFFRFPAQSLTDTLQAVGSFGEVDPTNIHNLAGKYIANYGTPFDLEDLKGHAGLDVQNITHVRIIDVIGTLNNSYATRDAMGRKINDQYPTAFPSGGFDLDAIGVVHLKTVGLKENYSKKINIYPNPFTSNITLSADWIGGELELYDSSGRMIKHLKISSNQLDFEELKKGLYQLRIVKGERFASTKLIKN